MKALVVDLLSYSRASRDEQNPFTVVNMQDVVSDALEDLHKSINIRPRRSRAMHCRTFLATEISYFNYYKTLSATPFFITANRPAFGSRRPVSKTIGNLPYSTTGSVSLLSITTGFLKSSSDYMDDTNTRARASDWLSVRKLLSTMEERF